MSILKLGRNRRSRAESVEHRHALADYSIEDEELRQRINRRWRKYLFRTCVILACIGAVAEVIIYLIDSHTRSLFLPDNIYRLRFIYIPVIVEVVSILATHHFLVSDKSSDGEKNMWSCILIFTLCADMQLVHYVYGPILVLPVVAIFFSVIFGSKRLTNGITVASFMSLALAGFIASQELRKDDVQLVSDVCIAALIMLVSYFGATLIDAYIIEQYRSISMGNTRQKQLIEELHIDPLMGIFNRKALHEKIMDLIGNGCGKQFCLMMIDIDDFKTINDTYGHLSGDAVLMELADIIKRNKESGVFAYRYGGEEIVLIFCRQDESRAYSIGENIRLELMNKKFDWLPDKPITISGGLAVLRQGQDGEDWLRAADEAMYVAKRQGKNRIIRDE